MKEDIAKFMYSLMTYDGVGENPEWVPSGNSLKQDEARRHANKVLKIIQMPTEDMVKVGVGWCPPAVCEGNISDAYWNMIESVLKTTNK